MNDWWWFFMWGVVFGSGVMNLWAASNNKRNIKSTKDIHVAIEKLARIHLNSVNDFINAIKAVELSDEQKKTIQMNLWTKND